jgi:flagellar motor component MotA
VDPVAFYFIFGLIGGVAGSFLAARLLRVDRLWALPGKPEPRSLIKPLTQAANVYQVTGPTGLVALAASADHPLLAYALDQIIQGHSAQQVRANVNRRLNALHETDRRCQYFGRVLNQFAPVLGIAGMAGAMYVGLSRLQDPTGSAAGLAIGVMFLLIGSNLIALFSRRLSKAAPLATTAGQVAGSMIVEAATLIRSGETAQTIERRLQVLLGDEPVSATIAKAA